MRSLQAVVIVLAVALGACGSGSSSGNVDQVPRVVATTTILGDVTAAIAGSSAIVEVLMPPGADPHDFSPSAAQVAAINRADLVVANGLGLEEGLGDIPERAEADGVVVLEVAELVDPLPLEGGEADHDDTEEDHHDHEGDDPHFWMDPDRMSLAVVEIAARLIEVSPDDASAIEANLATYRDHLADLDHDIADLIATIEPDSRVMVTNHDSFGYFADRYGLKVVGVVVPGGSTLAESSARDLAGLVAAIRDNGVRAIFTDTTTSNALPEAVASELEPRVEVVELYSGSLGPPGSDAETYLDMMRVNAERIALALTGGS